MIISIAGNIACGKNTLLNLLSALGYQVFYEDVESWTYLKSFYDNPHMAVLLQLQILQSRFEQMKEAKLLEKVAAFKNTKTPSELPIIFIERSTLDSLHVFAKNALLQGNMNETDYELLRRFTDDFGVFPDYTIYLKLDPKTSFERKCKRDRLEESNLQESYMYQIDECYNKFAASYPTNVITVDTNGCTPDMTLNKVLSVVHDFYKQAEPSQLHRRVTRQYLVRALDTNLFEASGDVALATSEAILYGRLEFVATTAHTRQFKFENEEQALYYAREHLATDV